VTGETEDGVVLDTDIASRVFRNRLTGPLGPRLLGRIWCVSFVTVAELWQWAELRSWGPNRRDALEQWLSDVVRLPSDDQVARTWAGMSAGAVRRGRPRPVNDTWIAAGCVARGLPLATGNTKDFADFEEHDGLTLLR
jgi:predicted nucleic acid-binding protein